MSELTTILEEMLAALEQAASRLRSTHARIAPLFPLSEASFEALDEESRERLDAYAVRYARCQDLLPFAYGLFGPRQPSHPLRAHYLWKLP